MNFITNSVSETTLLGQKVARSLKPGDVVALAGIFGAGKTYFTKGIARGLGVKKWRQVNSPSFVLCNIYKSKIRNLKSGIRKLYHFDAQRLPEADELFKLGLTDGLNDGVCVIEWAEKIPGLKSQHNIITVTFTVKGQHKRLIKVGGKLWKRNK